MITRPDFLLAHPDLLSFLLYRPGELLRRPKLIANIAVDLKGLD